MKTIFIDNLFFCNVKKEQDTFIVDIVCSDGCLLAARFLNVKAKTYRQAAEKTFKKWMMEE